MPGDRPDSALQSIGEICAKNFQRLYIKEDQDLRGRKQGEAASIIYDAAIGQGFPRENALIVYDEKEALKTAVQEAKSGDLIVEFYEELEPLVDYIHTYLN
jgi:cyanophycin synthetase